jgi:hypothetical protein
MMHRLRETGRFVYPTYTLEASRIRFQIPVSNSRHRKKKINDFPGTVSARKTCLVLNSFIFWKIMQYYIPDDVTLQNHRCENFKPCTSCINHFFSTMRFLVKQCRADGGMEMRLLRVYRLYVACPHRKSCTVILKLLLLFRMVITINVPLFLNSHTTRP